MFAKYNTDDLKQKKILNRKISNFVKMKTEFKLNKLKWGTLYKQIKKKKYFSVF